MSGRPSFRDFGVNDLSAPIFFSSASGVGVVKKVAKTGDGCIGCGSCASYCLSGAMSLRNFGDRQVYAQLDYAV